MSAVSVVLREAGGTAAVERALADPGLRSLTLDFEGVTSAAVFHEMVFWLARLPWSSLETLAATAAASGDHVALGFATAGLPSTLRSLAIERSAVGDAGVVHLAPGLPSSLERLSFAGNRVGARAVSSLLEKLPASVVALDLSDNPLGDEGARALGAHAAAARLRHLALRNVGLGEPGAAALGALEALERLDLSGNALGESAGSALRARFGARLSL